MPAQTASVHHTENPIGVGQARTASTSEIITFSPGQELAAQLNGVAFSAWRPSPFTPEAWASVATSAIGFIEAEANPDASLTAEVIIVEPDSRVWMIHSSEALGAKRLHFPRTKKDAQLSLQASAVRETWEKTGLKVSLKAVLGDIAEGDGTTRVYLATRVDGAPTMTGWECPSVSLVPFSLLLQTGELLGATVNRSILAALNASLEMAQAMQEAQPSNS